MNARVDWLGSGSWLRDARVPALLAGLLVFLLVYGTELGGFTLSLDEEIASFALGRAREWLAQGRWGMSLLTLLLPDFEAVPLLSTLVFGAGLLAATWCALSDLRLQRSAALLFAVTHVGFPLWLHIAQFNTLAAGFGLGIAAAASGAGLLLRPALRSRLLGVVLLAFAVSVYQTLALYSALYLLLALHARWCSQAGDARWPARLRQALPIALGWAAALLAYWLLQQAALLATGTAPAWVGSYMHPEQWRADPADALMRAMRYGGALVLGAHPIYLGWGPRVLFLAAAGLWPWRARDAAAPRRDWLLEALVLATALLLVLLPVLPSVGALPARAYVALPLLAAWLASRLGPLFDAWRPWILAVALGYFAFVAGSIGAVMFYTDRIVHNADAALARELVLAMQVAAGQSHAPPFVLVGKRGVPVHGQLRVAEAFGVSFFEHEGGNVHRVALLMQLQGAGGVQGIPLSSRPDLVGIAATMPAWPVPGSVRMVDGVALVKLGEPTPAQLPPD